MKIDTNFIDKTIKAVNDIYDLNMELVEKFDYPFHECFPTLSNYIFKVDGKEYCACMKLSIKEKE